VSRRLGHYNENWPDQMIKASQRAEKLGEAELAQHLKDEVKKYKVPQKFNAKFFYSEIEDHVVNSYDRIVESGEVFEDAIRHIGNLHGFSSKDLLKLFSEARARTVYDKQLKFCRRDAENRGRLSLFLQLKGHKLLD
jgi:hypothetical protein